MTHYDNLTRGIGKAAWGYFFVFLSFRLNFTGVFSDYTNTINLIPDFIGYYLFLAAIRVLEEEEKEVALLRVPCFILAVWSWAEWVFEAFFPSFNQQNDLAVIAILLIRTISLYFHFQFLTNLASLAEKYQPSGCRYDARLLLCRTTLTVTLTLDYVLIYINKYFFIPEVIWTLLTFILALVAMFGIIITLFRLKSRLTCAPAGESPDQPESGV